MSILPTRSTLLTSKLGDLREWGLIVTCPCRGFPRHMAVATLADELGNAQRLETVLMRLRCGQCRRAPGRVEAKRGDPFAARVAPVVLLESRGAVDRNRG